MVAPRSDVELRRRYTEEDLSILTEEEGRRFLRGGDRGPQNDIGLAWELLYRLEPELYDRLARAERIHAAILGWLPRHVGRIVEVAAGSGRLTAALIDRCDHLTAIEPAAPLRGLLAAKLQRRAVGNRLRLTHGFFDSLPVANRSAELVITCSALTPDPAHGGELGLAEMERVCTVGGRVVVIWPNHLGWLAEHGYRYKSFPGEMQMEFASVDEAVELLEIFHSCRRRRDPAARRTGACPTSCWASTHRGIWRTRRSRREDRDHRPLVAAIREPHLGGSQSFLADVAAGLTVRGHEVHVYAATGSAIAGVTVIDTRIEPAALRDCLYRANAALDGRPAERAFADVYAAVREASYHLVHNHAFDAPAISLAAALEVPVVHTLHLPPEPSMIAVLQGARLAECPPTVATVSSAQAGAWRAAIRVDVVLPNGVPTATIPWSASPGVGAVFAGRLSREKGVAEAIDIAEAAGVRIDLYGDPYDLYYAQERIYARRCAPSVVVHSAVERRVLWAAMARASVVLCPARWEEPFGMVAAEAQAAGTPVVAFRRGGLREVIVDGVTGFLVAPDDIAAAAEAVRNAARIARSACRRHAEVRFGLEASLEAHEELYRRVTQSADGQVGA